MDDGAAELDDEDFSLTLKVLARSARGHVAVM